jgi:hypothetical protein
MSELFQQEDPAERDDPDAQPWAGGSFPYVPDQHGTCACGPSLSGSSRRWSRRW